VALLARSVDLDAETWRRTFDTNVIGAALLTAAAVPHLAAAAGRAVYLSSVSASQTAPWPGLGAYAVSKAALDKLVEAWRVEHADISFTSLVVGDCGGGTGDSQTAFASGWDSTLAAELVPKWLQRGLMTGVLLDVNELVGVVDAVLRAGATASLPSVVVAPRPRPA
jgi:NAD(P)-dependent dehydrogenase (short-subunit alcohol dehydrogenase family)